jgi:hypothetical protein
VPPGPRAPRAWGSPDPASLQTPPRRVLSLNSDRLGSAFRGSSRGESRADADDVDDALHISLAGVRKPWGSAYVDDTKKRLHIRNELGSLPAAGRRGPPRFCSRSRAGARSCGFDPAETRASGRKRARWDSGLIVCCGVGVDPVQALRRACWMAAEQLTADLVSLEIVCERQSRVRRGPECSSSSGPVARGLHPRLGEGRRARSLCWCGRGGALTPVYPGPVKQ